MTSASDIQLTCVSSEELDEKKDELRRADVTVVFLNFDELYPNALTDIESKKISSDDIVEDSIKRCQELCSSIKM